MKKLSFLFLFIVVNSLIFGQNLSQVKLQGMEEQVIKDVICLGNKKVYCILTPEKENFKDCKYAIRVYNTNFSNFIQVPNLKEKYYPINVSGFHNLLCFPDVEKNTNSSVIGDISCVFITDSSLKVIKTLTYSSPNPKYSFFGGPTCKPNHDTTCLIVSNVIDPTPGKPSPKTNVWEHQVTVYDKNLNELFSAYLDFDKIFGKEKEKEINEYKFEYINNSLYMMASTVDVVTFNVSLPQRFFLVKIEKDGTSKIIHQETFTSGGFHFDYKVINKNKIVVSGIVGVKIKKFYQFTYNTSGNISSAKVSTYLFQTDDKEQKQKFSSFNLYKIVNLSTYVAKEGYFIVVDATNLSQDAPLLKNLYVLFVDFEGEVKWFDCIPREFNYPDSPMVNEDYLSSAFIKDNELHLIYHNLDKNTLSYPESFSSMTYSSGGAFCLALSVINPDQSISSKVLHSYKSGKTFWLPYTIFSTDNNYFILGGAVRAIPIHTRSYLGKISFE